LFVVGTDTKHTTFKKLKIFYKLLKYIVSHIGNPATDKTMQSVFPSANGGEIQPGSHVASNDLASLPASDDGILPTSPLASDGVGNLLASDDVIQSASPISRDKGTQPASPLANDDLTQPVSVPSSDGVKQPASPLASGNVARRFDVMQPASLASNDELQPASLLAGDDLIQRASSIACEGLHWVRFGKELLQRPHSEVYELFPIPVQDLKNKEKVEVIINKWKDSSNGTATIGNLRAAFCRLVKKGPFDEAIKKDEDFAVSDNDIETACNLACEGQEWVKLGQILLEGKTREVFQESKQCTLENSDRMRLIIEKYKETHDGRITISQLRSAFSKIKKDREFDSIVEGLIN
jgi:hypothetical protein